MTSFKQKIGLICLGLFLGVILLEIGLRLAGLAFLTFQEQSNLRSLQQKGAYRILCLGDSMTALGGEDSYPRQLEDILNSMNKGIKFTVINKGVPGINSHSILERIGKNIDTYHPDMVITMMGINDGVNPTPYGPLPAFSRTKRFFSGMRVYKLALLLSRRIFPARGESAVPKLKAGRKIVEPKPEVEAAVQLKATPREEKYQAAALIERGSWYMMQGGKSRQAIYWLQKALVLEPNNIDALVKLGVCNWGMGNKKEAEEAFLKAISVDPKSYKAWRNLGTLYVEEKKYQEADETIKQVEKFNPRPYAFLLDMAELYTKAGKYSKAEPLFRRSLDFQPKNVWTHLELGKCYLKQGEIEKALKVFKQGSELQPGNDRFHSVIGRILEDYGVKKMAREYYRKGGTARLNYYNPVTRDNYRQAAQLILRRGIKLVCLQYPGCGVKALERILGAKRDIIFISNEKVFREALAKGKWEDYYTDKFAGAFGHCTARGNKLMAANIAEVLSKKYFGRDQ